MKTVAYYLLLIVIFVVLFLIFAVLVTLTGLKGAIPSFIAVTLTIAVFRPIRYRLHEAFFGF